MLTTGFDGGNTTASAAAIASSTPGAGAACAAPTAMMSAAGVCACSRSHHSWKCTVRRSPPSSSTTCVSTWSSDIGSSATPGCHRSQSTWVTADSGRPDASSWLRRICVAKSRSPSVNQSGLAP